VSLEGIRTHAPLLGRQPGTINLLNKLTVTQLAELSKLNKSYISQVKYGVHIIGAIDIIMCSVKESAQNLGISDSHCRRLLETGKIEGIKLGHD
tara:strand:- start:732 stop:1013 length:282 start_codon:yes stop_codon:yes gene_type:complete